ncbi:hypothetical protein [Lysinibacillus sp. 3P01SB]|uniref:hypothetical protein n=1 Tax=Lysinibacillus sp. 3P01SB TaxID=3132284 RepID=UPI0039A4BFBD
MFKGEKEIQMIEYVPESVKKAGVRLAEVGEVQTISFTARKLVIALARTILAMNPKDKDVVHQAISSYSALYPLISEDKEFRFAADVDAKIRDYILSTRTGELAPAIGYLFAQEQLNKPFIVDFSGQMEDEAAKAAVPDMIAASSTGEITFIESKGSKDTRNKGKLRDALIQSESAATLVEGAVDDFYGLFISIPKADADYPASIHYTSTINEGQRKAHDLRRLMFKHYASWFMLLGFQEEAERLADGENIMIKRPKKEVMVKKKKYYLLDTSDSLFFNAINIWDKQFKRAKFAIAADVFTFLTGRIDGAVDFSSYGQLLKQGKKYDFFADGTAVFYK